jgi:GMC oxidoreductase
VEIGRAMGGKTVVRGGAKRPYTTTVYQSTHNCGGAIMGEDPRTSVVNRYLQCWDVPNVFSVGASAFPQNGAYNYSQFLFDLVVPTVHDGYGARAFASAGAAWRAMPRYIGFALWIGLCSLLA